MASLKIHVDSIKPPIGSTNIGNSNNIRNSGIILSSNNLFRNN
jgi:hypothetical protein